MPSNATTIAPDIPAIPSIGVRIVSVVYRIAIGGFVAWLAYVFGVVVFMPLILSIPGLYDAFSPESPMKLLVDELFQSILFQSAWALGPITVAFTLVIHSIFSLFFALILFIIDHALRAGRRWSWAVTLVIGLISLATLFGPVKLLTMKAILLFVVHIIIGVGFPVCMLMPSTREFFRKNKKLSTLSAAICQ